MRRISLAGLALAGLLAACSTTTPGATTAPGSSPGGIPTVPPLSTGLSSFAIPSFAVPSFNSDPALAARFPTSIAGSPMSVQTVRGTDYLALFEGDTEAAARAQVFIQAVGVALDALSLGFGSFMYEGSNEDLTAVRAAGADASRLLTATVELTREGADDPTTVQVSQSTVGGKPVTMLVSPYETTSYIYGAGDIAWLVETDDPALADQVMGAIP